MSLARLAKYHLIMFILFSLLVILSFYFTDGGELDTPGTLELYYFVSAILEYLPLLFALTLFNFIILTCGFTAFSGSKERIAICCLPILIFWLWYIFSGGNSVTHTWSLSNVQFILISGIWSFLLVMAYILYSGARKYLPAVLLPGFIMACWFFLTKFNFDPPRLMLTDHQFRFLLTIWTILNSGIYFRLRRKYLALESLSHEKNKNIGSTI